MMQVRIVDVTADASFRLIPPCADPGFDHRTCDYWEDADRGSKAARASWLEAAPAPPPAGPAADNPFAPPRSEPDFNPFARTDRSSGPAFNPFADDDDEPADNPFAPTPRARAGVGEGGPRKLGLLGRGLAVFGSYAKVLLVDDVAVELQLRLRVLDEDQRPPDLADVAERLDHRHRTDPRRER